MSHGRPPQDALPEPSRILDEGWHCNHLYYLFDRSAIDTMSPDEIDDARADLVAILDPESDDAPARLQTSVVSGHQADFSLMVMDPDPLKIDSLHQRLMSSRMGFALEPVYSFVSISQLSEYVPTIEQYAARLVKEGETEGSDSYNAKVKAYTAREPVAKKNRLTPEFPDYPVMCFYPMNKKREVGENWFMLPIEERNRLMSEHARSGMAFAGRVFQLITVGVGLDDWEWGVTLWARNPAHLVDIVYKMRFDEASARYAEFGPFFTSYLMSAADMLEHCKVQSPSSE